MTLSLLEESVVCSCFAATSKVELMTFQERQSNRVDFSLTGPNVFVDSTGVGANNDTGPHERWAMGILYDNITCQTINVRQRAWMGSGQGWAGELPGNLVCAQNLPLFLTFFFLS